MNALMDIIISMFMGSIIVLIAISATDSSTQEFFNQNSDAIVQRNLTQVSDIMQFDLRKIGFSIPEGPGSNIVQLADSNRFRFLAHLNMRPANSIEVPGVSTYDSIVDTLEYQILPDETFNFIDTSITTYKIHRRVVLTGHAPFNSMIGIIGNDDVFEYLNQLGQPVTVPLAIKMVQITLTAYNPRVILSPELVVSYIGSISDQTFRKKELRRILRASYWRQTRLVSKNLRR